jgi:hypothetical protein
MTDSITRRAIAVADYLHQRGLPATPDHVEQAFKVLERAELRTATSHEDHMDNDYAPPNAYERELKTLRAATATHGSRFEDRYGADRLRDIEATRAALDAEERAPHLTAAELAEFRAPNPYAAVIEALQEKKTR